MSQVPEPGNVVLGTVDSNWRIDRVSQDVTPLLGLTPEQCTGQPVLGVIHPSDLPAFLAAVEHARRGERAVRLTLRLSARSRDWTEVAVVLATIAPGDPPPLAFALIRDDAAADPPGPGDSSREMRLEAHMLRIADELHAAGLIPRLQQLPALTDEPRLGKLTSREWAVLTRLLDGQRIPAIAADLYVSQSTVRNHLSSIYAKLGVHSQVDLIRLIRRGTRPPAEGGKASAVHRDAPTSAVSNRTCCRWRGRSPLQATTAAAVSGRRRRPVSCVTSVTCAPRRARGPAATGGRAPACEPRCRIRRQAESRELVGLRTLATALGRHYEFAGFAAPVTIRIVGI